MFEGKRHLKYINSALDESYDVFICSASFEDRCITIPKKINKKRFKNVLIVKNLHGSQIVSDNAEIIRRLYSKNSSIVAIDFRDSIKTADAILGEVIGSKKSGQISVLLDITTFTHETLLIVLKVLSLSKRISKLTCVYCNAAEYCPGIPIENKWLSRGSKQIHPVLGYSGILLPSQKFHLIMLVGYEYSRAIEAISLIEPSSITLVYSSPENAITEKDKDANSIYEKIISNMYFEYPRIDHVQMPCDEPDTISSKLKELYVQHAGENIIVVPMNTKMSTIGVFLSVIGNEDVCVSYAQAVLYNESNYSVPGTRCYIYNIK